MAKKETKGLYRHVGRAVRGPDSRQVQRRNVFLSWFAWATERYPAESRASRRNIARRKARG